MPVDGRMVRTCGSHQFLERSGVWQLREAREQQTFGELSGKRCHPGRMLELV